MSKTSGFSKEVLDLIFLGTAIPGIAENHSSPLTEFYLSLHTDSPGEAGDQTTNEVTTGQYGQYARQAVSRSTGFNAATLADPAVVTLVADVLFAEMTSGTGATVTHIGIGTAASGAGSLKYHGAINPNIELALGVVPKVKKDTEIRET